MVSERLAVEQMKIYTSPGFAPLRYLYARAVLCRFGKRLVIL